MVRHMPYGVVVQSGRTGNTVHDGVAVLLRTKMTAVVAEHVFSKLHLYICCNIKRATITPSHRNVWTSE